ncbi:MAG: hypothetical protein G01um101448_70 [Parcubacteria group bacterium Gr01-1014_48]|nr:MAG: hypothetical protein Greene041614_152 [Parcubacteria group bacterium Greene0416_14]TSC74551.1 MAG: hypothetical protein G01um101448_70 [Parcubacteria group bacterium Gr01-1014_48]TSD01427.1 MAG: hypothetical protein Greene101415_274 [Parcubacteria group bacterium Greene1014_15]
MTGISTGIVSQTYSRASWSRHSKQSTMTIGMVAMPTRICLTSIFLPHFAHAQTLAITGGFSMAPIFVQ